MSHEKILEIIHLQKNFGKFKALKDINFSISKGEIFGFIGPNGAGKSTTIRILLGILRKSGGQAKIFGKEVFENSQYINKRIAYVPGDVYLWPNLSGGELIDYLLKLRGAVHTHETDRLIKLFELDPTKKAGTYSKGNRQKVAIIAALAANADFFIFDEPTSGLDPLNEIRFQDELMRLKDAGKSILLSSHILSEVEKLADHVAIIREGEIVEMGSLDSLHKFTTTNVLVKTAMPFQHFNKLNTITNLEELSPNKVTFSIDNEEIDKLISVLHGEKVELLEITKPKLEEIFMKYYGDHNGRSEF